MNHPDIPESVVASAWADYKRERDRAKQQALMSGLNCPMCLYGYTTTCGVRDWHMFGHIGDPPEPGKPYTGPRTP